MATKIIVHSPKGGQGKTTVTANLAMMLAEAGHRVLVLDVDESETRGLARYFNVEGSKGLSELVNGAPLETLIGEVKPNLFFLPGGDLVQASRAAEEDFGTPNAVLEERLTPYEDHFDYIVFDTSPNPKTRLTFNIFYYGDQLIVPIETRRAGHDIFKDFMERVMGYMVPKMREAAGKPELKLTKIIPYWHDPRASADIEILEELQEEYGNLLTKPVQSCTSMHRAWSSSLTLKAQLKSESRRPRKSEALALEIFDEVIAQLVDTQNSTPQAVSA